MSNTEKTVFILLLVLVQVMQVATTYLILID